MVSLMCFLYIFSLVSGTKLEHVDTLKVWQQTSDAACKVVDFNYELTGVLGIKREHQTTEYAQLVVKAKGRENVKGVEVDEMAKAPGTLSLKTVDDMTDVLETPKLSQSLSEFLSWRVSKLFFFFSFLNVELEGAIVIKPTGPLYGWQVVGPSTKLATGLTPGPSVMKLSDH
jgi:hypothetical protein